MKYTVHLYPIVMVKVEGVEAESQVEAIKKAEMQTDLNALFAGYADDIDCFHVDEEGDTEYANSQWYDKNYLPL